MDEKALRKACEAIAEQTMRNTPEPHKIEDVITSEEVEAVVATYCDIGRQQAAMLEHGGEDPALVLVAIDYLSRHAIPPMRDDSRWFRESLHTLLVLARPTITGLEATDHPFLEELLQGIAEAKRHRTLKRGPA